MLHITNLQVNITTNENVIRPVDGVSLRVRPGETVGIVGESGSGKSVLAQSIVRLNPEPMFNYASGEIIFQGQNILQLNERKMRNLRAKKISFVFQDPMASLNPVITIGDQLMEAIRANEAVKRKQAKKQAVQLLADVGISDPKRRMREYPHEVSGGMCQRILIAIALAAKPKLLIADEPTTALDVTIQAQILNVFKQIQEKYNTAILMITHDLGVLARIADRAYVMYAGRILEEGNIDDIFYRPSSPYTLSLLKSQPRFDVKKRERLFSISGQPPKLSQLFKGCNFYERCPYATEVCLDQRPKLSKRSNNHFVACVLSRKIIKNKQLTLSEQQLGVDE